MAEESPIPVEASEDTMLQEAIEAISLGDKVRAKDLITRLLKTKQREPIYWIWMSATVDSPKERIYCLQTALKLDPENASAKRGLILLGALPPDDTVPPFPVNRARLWEEELSKADKEEATGAKAILQSPVGKLLGWVALGGVLLAGVLLVILFSPRASIVVRATNTPGPSPTYTLTPTFVNATGQPVSDTGPTPLWALLDATYTPTPLYINTPRAPQSGDTFRAAQRALANGNWDEVITFMQQIAQLEPTAADPYFYIGEAYQAKGNYNEAIASYDKALEIDPGFAPAHLGRAHVYMKINPNAEILNELNQAIVKDPKYVDAYLERARYYLDKNKPDDALQDLQDAAALSPDSALVHLYMAKALLALEENEQALTEAQKAHETDLTLLDGYYTLAQAYIANGQGEKAVEVLETYIVYAPQDVQSTILLAEAYYEDDRYEDALNLLDKATTYDRKNGNIYLQRGKIYLKTENFKKAVSDLDLAVTYLPNSYDAHMFLTMALYQTEDYGNSYEQAEQARALAVTDQQDVMAWYYKALSLEGLGYIDQAVSDYKGLLKLSNDVLTEEMRADLEQRIKTLKPTKPTTTPSPAPTRQPTKTPPPTSTRIPTQTPRPSQTPKTTPTPSPKP
jgi:tetratricopeptide (TPR) repeat protein